MANKNPNNSSLNALIDISEIIQNGTMWLNEEGHIISVNEKFAEDLGYTKKSFSPKTIYEVNPTMSILAWRKFWKQLLKNTKVSQATEQITADEVIYPVEMYALLVESESDRVCLCIVKNLMEVNRFLDLLNITSKLSNIGSWQWDLVKNEFVATDATYDLLDLPADNFKDFKTFRQHISDRLNNEEKVTFDEQIDNMIQQGDHVELEFSFAFENGYRNLNLIAQPVWLEDQTIKIHGTLQNLDKVARRTDDLHFMKFCIDNARDMIFWVEKDGIISYVNHATCKRLGYSQKELVGMNVKDLAPFSHVDLDQHWEELKQEKSIEFESVHISKSGEEIPVSIVANYVNYRGREFNCGFVRDLTGRKKQDQLITMAKRSLDQSNEMIFWLDQDGSFRYANNAFISTSGYNRSEIKKMRVYDFFPNSNQEQFSQGWEKLKQGGKLESIDRLLKTKSGNIIPTEMSVSIVKFENEEYSATVLRDVSERKQKEAELNAYIQKIEELQRVTEAENIELKEEFDINFNFANIISKDPNYKKVLHQVEQVADTGATVLILGETGTGKELLARAIHQLSDRSDMPMIKVNCGALPENLIESELFGHEKGAFTGAHQQKIGKFERAHKGTIFLDEIGELPLDLQAKLLRVLQEGEIERVGGTKLIHIDVRIIAATNRHLEQRVQEGKFREDLFYRLNVFPIVNIPLRERREDIPILVKHFTDKYAKKLNKEIVEISPNALNKLMSYNFLGNVRELENMVERAVILAKSSVLTFDASMFKKSSKRPSRFKTFDEIQKDHIIAALKITKGKVSGAGGAAALLDMNDKTLTSKMKKLGINRKSY